MADEVEQDEQADQKQYLEHSLALGWLSAPCAWALAIKKLMYGSSEFQFVRHS